MLDGLAGSRMAKVVTLSAAGSPLYVAVKRRSVADEIHDRLPVRCGVLAPSPAAAQPASSRRARGRYSRRVRRSAPSSRGSRQYD